MPPQKRDVEWADGIRGVASLFIVTSHSIRALLPNYLYPADEYNAPPHLFQLPFLRIVAAGPFWVSMFFLLSGYVCAIKPIRLSNAGQVDEARRVIASSAFRRVLRIGLPATVCTTMAWALCQLGMFELHTDIYYWSGWLEGSTPRRRHNFVEAVQNLFRQCLNTWANYENEYEGNQWTLSHEMRGSLLVFLLLTVTAPAAPQWRRIIFILTAVYFYNSGEFIGPFCFFCGALLADLSLVLRSKPPKDVSTYQFDSQLERIIYRWPIGLAILAFFLGTMPPENQHFSAWSRHVYNFFQDYITATGGATDRVIGAFAGVFFLFATLYSQSIRTFFSHKYFVFLGGISFPLYLLHGTFIRIPLQWCVMRLLPQVDDAALYTFGEEDHLNAYLLCGTLPCRLAATVVYVVWLGCLLIAAQVWKRYVDVHGINFSRWAENVISGKQKVEFNVPSWSKSGNLSSLSRATGLHIGSRVDTEKLQ